MDVMGKTALGAAATVAVLLLAGCGDDAGSPSDETTSSPTAIPPTEDVTPPPTTPGATELVGVPEAGVEAGCWLLDGHLLLGGDEQLLSSGQRLRITGQIERGVASFCQQGTPFRVDEITPAE